MRRVLLVLPLSAAVVLWPRAVFACPVCFGATDAPMVRGSSMGILALLVVTAGMLATFGWFFRTLAKREREAATLRMADRAAVHRSDL